MTNALIFFIGLGGIAAQVLILRELMVGFLGNELTLGALLASWLFSEAVGVLIAGRLVNNKNKFSLFLLFQALFCFSLPASIYFSRVFKFILGMPVGQGLGLPMVYLVSISAYFLVGFSHGALFPLGCELTKGPGAAHEKVGARVNFWEVAGSVAGGVIVTFLFIGRLNSFQSAFIIIILNLAMTLLFLKNSGSKSRFLAVIFFSAASILALIGLAQVLQRSSAVKQYPQGRLLDYSDSAYANIAVVEREGQVSFFYNGLPAVITPHPDTEFVENMSHLPVLFSPAPDNILLIGSGPGGLIGELLKHPVKKITYVEMDRLLVDKIAEFAVGLADAELADPRVHCVFTDARMHLRSSADKYDLALISLPGPVDLTLNRYYTREFFSLLKSRLSGPGVLALSLEGTLDYMGQELRDLNATVLRSLRANFANVRVIPGYFNIMLASGITELDKLDHGEIYGRWHSSGVRAKMLTPDYIAYRLGQERFWRHKEQLAGSGVKENTDMHPLATFIELKYWNKKFSPGLAWLLEAAGRISIKSILYFIAAISAGLGVLVFKSGSKGKVLAAGYCIFTSGAFGMASNLILLFTFQVVYASLYYLIGLLTAVFMLGIAIGAALGYKRIRRITAFSLINTELLMILFCILMAGFVFGAQDLGATLPAIFGFMFVCAGFFTGFEFSLASRYCSALYGEGVKIPAFLYACDIAGGCLAGVLAAAVILPLLGLVQTSLAVALFKAASLLLLAIFSLTKPVKYYILSTLKLNRRLHAQTDN